jgi:hypothetical protein
MPLEAPTAERPLQTAVWRPMYDSISQKAFRAEKQAIRRIHGGRKCVTCRSERACTSGQKLSSYFTTPTSASNNPAIAETAAKNQNLSATNA